MQERSRNREDRRCGNDHFQKKQFKTFHRNEEQEFASVMFNCCERKKTTITKPQKNITMKFKNIGDKEKILETILERMRSHMKDWGSE